MAAIHNQIRDIERARRTPSRRSTSAIFGDTSSNQKLAMKANMKEHTMLQRQLKLMRKDYEKYQYDIWRNQRVNREFHKSLLEAKNAKIEAKEKERITARYRI